MNDQELDEKLRRVLRQESPRLPKLVSERMNLTLEQLPEKRPRRSLLRWSSYLGAGIVAATVAVVTIGAISPTAAETISRLPLMRSVFQIVGDEGLQQGANKHSTAVEIASYDQGKELFLSEVIYDGERLSVGLVHDQNVSLSLSNSPRLLSINGSPINYSAGLASKEAEEGKQATTIRFVPSEPLPESFELELAIGGLQVIQDGQATTVNGKWKFKTNVQQVTADIRTFTFEPPLLAKNDEYQIRVNKLVLTPITTSLHFEWEENAIAPMPVLEVVEPSSTSTPYPNGAKTPPPPDQAAEEVLPDQMLHEQIDYRLYTDNGLELESFSVSGSGQVDEHGDFVQSYVAHYAPVSDTEYLTLMPTREREVLVKLEANGYRSATIPQEVEVPLTSSFPLVLDQGDAGSLTINNVQFQSDATWIYYEVIGKLPFAQSTNLYLKDAKGKRYGFDRYDVVRLSHDKYTYKAKLPPLADRKDDLQVVTNELRVPEDLQALSLQLQTPSTSGSTP